MGRMSETGESIAAEGSKLSLVRARARELRPDEAVTAGLNSNVKNSEHF